MPLERPWEGRHTQVKVVLQRPARTAQRRRVYADPEANRGSDGQEQPAAPLGCSWGSFQWGQGLRAHRGSDGTSSLPLVRQAVVHHNVAAGAAAQHCGPIGEAETERSRNGRLCSPPAGRSRNDG